MQNLKFKISKKTGGWCSGDWCTNKGFTLLEILVVLVVLGFLVAMVAPRFTGFTEEAAITTTLGEMDSIAETIRERFYPDLGLIPEDAANPEWAIRFLLLKDDGVGAGGINRPERQEMYVFLSAKGRAHLIDWDRYSRRGWRGPYMEREIVVYDSKGTPDSADDEWYPLIIDAWGERVDYSVDPDGVTGEYRIFGGQDRNLAQIVSYGADGEADSDVVIGTDGNDYVCIQPHTAAAVNRPISGADWADYWALDNTQSGGTWGTGTDYQTFGDDDLVMFIFGTGPIRRP